MRTIKSGSLGGFDFLLNCLLQLAGLQRQFFALGLDQESIKTTAVFNRFQRVGADAELVGITQRIRNQCDITKVRHEARLGLVVSVGNFVARKPALARKFAAARHVDLHK
jgi:hypothetical protein